MPAFISQNAQLIGVLVTVFGGLFAFIKWIDLRNRELKEKRYARYTELVGTIAGKRPDGVSPTMLDQIVAVWFLLEYKEYRKITKRIFHGPKFDQMANQNWISFVLPEIKAMLSELQS